MRAFYLECGMSPTAEPRAPRFLAAAVALATILGVWLRIHGITAQIVIDDEWHALHKLMTASYAGIFETFGIADHSIPLTLLYKALADTVGLAEGRLRSPQIICGIATVPVAAWLAWRATRDAAAACLVAFLVAGAPFLVMWSRFARPYAITLLLTTLSVAAIWAWRSRRRPALAACAAVSGALSAWFHAISAVPIAVACIHVFVADLRSPPPRRAQAALGSFRLGLGVAAAMAVLLAPPLLHDREALEYKGGGDHPGFSTIDRMVAIIWGGVPTPVMVAATAFASWGAIVLARRDRALASYLGVLAVVPALFLATSGAVWIFGGQNFLRYQLPLQLICFFLGALGFTDVARRLSPRQPERAAALGAIAVSAAYLLATPAIAYVDKLGPWFAHPDYHWDYRHRWLETRRVDPASQPPDFYRELGRVAPGAANVIEAPYLWEGPFNPFDYYATFHRQRETMGMLYDLCLHGDRVGEPAHDRRFRFRRFVFLDDVASVRSGGARYLLLNRRLRNHVGAQYDDALCMEKLTRLYGTPFRVDSRLAVFDLHPEQGPPKLQ